METSTINDFPTGAKCTVSWHYGHTDTETVMTITGAVTHPLCKTGISVSVDGLQWPVDSGLINLIKQENIKKS